MESRLTELESKLGFQDDLLDALNAVVARQQQDIELLQGQVKLLYDQLRSLSPTELSAPVGDERPPHY